MTVDENKAAGKELGRLRIDKWLWAARFYKTRSLAAQAVEGGKVKLNGERTKPGRGVRSGDRLEVRSGELQWLIEVRAVSARRGPASGARHARPADQARPSHDPPLHRRVRYALYRHALYCLGTRID